MRLWLVFLFDIHVPLDFPLQTLSCSICILHTSVSQDSYDVKKLSDIFVEQNNKHNRRAGSKLAVSRESSVIRKQTYYGLYFCSFRYVQ